MNRFARAALSTLVVLALAGAVVATWVALHDDATHGAAVLRDMDGRRIALDEVPDVEGADLQPTGGRFQAPNQGLDVPLVEMSLTQGSLNPPTLTEAFVVRDDVALGAGEAAADGTAEPTGEPARMVAMHAVRDGRAPGNAFFEPAAANPQVMIQPGDPLLVGEDAYTVTGTEVLLKADAAASAEIWGVHTDGDDRLVVITCLQRAGQTGRAEENLVVHAVRSA